MERRVLVTGGCGFIGSALVRRLLRDEGTYVLNVDRLTYAANLQALAEFRAHPRHAHLPADIRRSEELLTAFEEFQPTAVMHLAAESHVDRSIDEPEVFLETNVLGTFRLLQETRRHLERLAPGAREQFRFVHLSTDEVFGSLELDDPPFDATTRYHPNSPYSASKAASDHLARAWHETYGLPVIVSNCSNNYGPWQFPEKLIPLLITKLVDKAELPIYGAGDNVRDWLFVGDHVEALVAQLERGVVGETYVVGGRAERSNIEVVRALCSLMDERAPQDAPHSRLIKNVADRPGHDLRYAIDPSKIETDLGWRPTVAFEQGLAATLDWFLANEAWWRGLLARQYDGARIGLGEQSPLLAQRRQRALSNQDVV